MKNLRGARALITGASGFLGANLLRTLVNRGAEVHAVVRAKTNRWRIEEVLSGARVHVADLVDLKSLKDILNAVNPDFILHLAFASGHPKNQEEKADLWQSSVVGTSHLLEASANCDYTCLVHFGSSLEYGAGVEPAKEADPVSPITDRGAAKAGATALCSKFARENSKPIVTLRLFSVYGFWEGPTRLVPTAIRAALLDEELALTPPGCGRDFIFVDDVIEACLFCMEEEKAYGEIINIGSGRWWSHEEMVKTLQELCGRKFRVRIGGYPPSPYDVSARVADIDKAKQLLNWRPGYTLSQGLETTVAWIRKHADIYLSRVKTLH